MGKDQELLQAVKTEDLMTVQKLLQRPKPGKASRFGLIIKKHLQYCLFSPLHHAALNGNVEVISLLLESQAIVDIRDQKGMRPLHYAAWQGKSEPMKLLLKSGSSVNSQSDEGQIPLHLAAQHGHYDVSEMLLQHQSNPCIVDNGGRTPLDLACEFGRVGVVQLLLSSNMCAALLEAKPGDSTDPNGTSPLHLAAKNGHIDIIRLLIQAGIDINRQTKAGTALHEAALCGKTDVVRLLLDSGINATVRNTYSQTALDIVYQFTATQASREIKQMLRDASAALQVRALKDYCNNYDLTSLNIKAGDVITVLEQHSDGRWKGCIHDNRTGNDRVGYFPSSLVEVISKRPGTAGSRGSESSPHGSPTPAGGPQGGSSEEIWVLRKPVAGNSRAAPSSSSSSSSLIIPPAFSEAVIEWLSEFQLQVYAPNFISAGYDIPTISRITPEDLTAIGVTKPGHRKKITSEINKITVNEWLPDKKPANLGEWLAMIGLSQYHQVLVRNGYENIEFITDITWEDLQDIGITKLGHQKKLMLAVKKLAEIQKASDGRNTLRKKPPAAQEVMAIESPPHDSGECMSPKMSTFQDSELSGELQAALTRPADLQDGTEVRTNSSLGAQYRARSLHENSMNKSRDTEDPSGPPKKEARTMRQSSQGGQRSVSSAQAKPRQSYPQGTGPPYTPPQTPTKTKPPTSQTVSNPPGKQKPSSQLLQQTEKPMTPRAHPQSPTQRSHSHPAAQPVETMEAAPQGPAVSVPLLCLPPEGNEACDEYGLPKKRAHSLNRYAVSDGEQERDELNVPDLGGKYATVQHRVGRSNSVKGQADKNVNRSQSFALRQKKKGPPPPPPKRSSSAISSSSSNLTEVPKETSSGPLLEVPYQPQRRASDLGGTVDSGSAGSVRSIAAMLEMSSIGGGPKGLIVSRQVGSAVAKQRDAIGLDGEVVNRRRTISGPVTELVAAAKRGPHSSGSSAENLPFAEDGNLTIKQRPRQGKDETEEGLEMSYSLPQENPSRVDATASLKRTVQSTKQQPNGTKFHLTESNTVKRRPKSKDKDTEELQDGQMPVPYENGTGTIKRRPVSEMTVSEQPRPQEHPENSPRRDSGDLEGHVTESAPRKSVKPPVSPKPVLAQHMKKQGPPAAITKKAPFPGPTGAPVEGKKVPPPILPKPTPPPTAPKPSKNVLQSLNATPNPTPTPSPAKQTVTRMASTDSTPQTSGPPTPIPTPPPVKPPRSSISGVSMDSSAGSAFVAGVVTVDAVHQKIEETSASLAAALQAVEDKIKEDGQKDSLAESKSTVSILDDIGSMFDDLADQLDAMLE
uniref:CASK interacting protein 1 n=1 Tax=Cyprinus carpio TaxID=7962 RepID=A0A8C1LZ62_CYPCA